MIADTGRKAVHIIKNPEIIRLLSSFIKSEILRLISKKPMTETQLSRVLDLTKAAVGYHLQPLKNAGLIKIDRYETGEHGISKYYSTIASFFIIDPDCIPNDAKRYFLETQMMHLEGMLSVLTLQGRIKEVTSDDLEKLAEVMLRQLKLVGQKYIEETGGATKVESLRIRIHAEAFENLIKQSEYLNLPTM